MSCVLTAAITDRWTRLGMTWVILGMILMPALVSAGEIPAELPPPVVNDEAALLAAAQAVEPELLDGGYRQYDIRIAEAATWDGPVDLMMRLWLPPADDHAGPYPVIAYVHGGGFIGGSYAASLLSERGDFAAAWRASLDAGMAVASLSYRKAREAGWPAPVSDPLAALRFLARHGGHWHLDGRRFGVSGHSAGARSAALIGMVPQDAFHVADLPWQGETVTIAATWLWAGSALTAPELHQFAEFGKPRNYSVMRLHHGEHPAWSDGTRHSMRIRNNWPHISMALPPLFMLRGDRDYGGDHSDAETAVALWQAMGVEATLSIVPGGHGAGGPPEPYVDFFRQHLVEAPFTPPARDPLEAARLSLAQGHPYGALEILAAAHTGQAGRQPPPGQWIFSHDGCLFWLADDDQWPDDHRHLAQAAQTAAAQIEAAAAQRYRERREWLRAAEAARTVRRLLDGDVRMRAVSEQIEALVGAEQRLFEALAAANAQIHAGEQAAALAILADHDDPRIAASIAGLQTPPDSVPSWAEDHGVDLYGPWVSLGLGQGVDMRLRWVPPGSWELPEHLHFGNRVDQPLTTTINIADGFWLADTQTTWSQWRAVNGQDLADLTEAQAQRPVNHTDYLQIVAWLDTLGARHEDLLVRLPTEEEWIHAATQGGRDDVMAGIDLHSVHALVVDPDDPGPLPVRSTVPDLGGYYGLLGGVMEWTASPGRATARFSDETGRMRIIAYPIARGGAWSNMPHSLGIDTRSQQRHGNRQSDLGFRVAIGGGPEAADWRRAVIRR